MKATDILELDAVTFVEPSFSALADPVFNEILTELVADEGRLLLDEHEEPLAIAFHSPDGWIAGSFLCRKPTLALIERFEEVNGEIFQDDRAVWAAAVREYFSMAIAREVPLAVEDLNPVREQILAGVISSAWGRGAGETCIDCGCGSGVGSLVLRELGYTPLSFDNDASLLSRGLAEKRLLPEETMCLDATIASACLDPVPRGIGIMMGEINTFSADMWHVIVAELLKVTGETLITVGTEPEAQQVRLWAEELGRTVDVKESPGDAFYDHWVCLVHTAAKE